MHENKRNDPRDQGGATQEVIHYVQVARSCGEALISANEVSNLHRCLLDPRFRR